MQLVSFNPQVHNNSESNDVLPNAVTRTDFLEALAETFTLVRKRSLIAIYARQNQDDEVFNDRFLKYKRALLQYINLANSQLTDKHHAFGANSFCHTPSHSSGAETELLIERAKRLIKMYRELSFEHEKFERELCSIEKLLIDHFENKTNASSNHYAHIRYS